MPASFNCTHHYAVRIALLVPEMARSGTPRQPEHRDGFYLERYLRQLSVLSCLLAIQLLLVHSGDWGEQYYMLATATAEAITMIVSTPRTPTYKRSYLEGQGARLLFG